jgi:hypothetical protein
MSSWLTDNQIQEKGNDWDQPENVVIKRNNECYIGVSAVEDYKY